MFSTIVQKPQISPIMQKREQFKNQIRRQFLNDYFAAKRKQKLKRDTIQRQNQIHRENMQIHIQAFHNAQSNKESQEIIKQIHLELCKENVDIIGSIQKHHQSLLKMFIVFPQYKYSTSILFLILDSIYENTFHVDDQNFFEFTQLDPYTYKAERKDMNIYQETIDVLMETIDKTIPCLEQRKNIQQALTMDQFKELQNYNRRVEKKLKVYMQCFERLAAYFNSFLMRYQYIEKYMIRWAKWLLIDYNCFKSQFLMYVHVTSRFIQPFQSLINNAEFQISNQRFQDEQLVINRLFSLCVPELTDNQKDKVSYFSALITSRIFSFQQVRIQALIHYMNQIFSLIRTIMCYQQYYKQQMVKNIIPIIGVMVDHFIQVLNDENTSNQIHQQIRKINILQILHEMNYFATFDFYLKSQSFCFQIICELIRKLVDYALNFQLNIDTILNDHHLFLQICHLLHHYRIEIVQTNLFTIQLICQYSQKYDRKDILAKMIHYGVDFRLQNLLTSTNQDVKQLAAKILDWHFTEDKVQYVTAHVQELERYQNQDMNIIPDRDYIYE